MAAYNHGERMPVLCGAGQDPSCQTEVGRSAPLTPLVPTPLFWLLIKYHIIIILTITIA